VINAWLDLSVIGIFVCLVIVYGLTAALIAWLTFRSPLRARIQGFSGVVAPFFGSVALLFALLTGFLAAEVIERHQRAVRAVQVEGGALSSLHALTLASTADAAAIREALRAYLEALVNDEWPQMANAQTSTKADATLAALLRAVADPRIAPATDDVVHSSLVQLALQAATARSDRLALNSYHSDDAKWATVLLLCLMTQLAIGMVHLDRPRAHAAALAVFSVAAIIALGMIAIQEAPFDGALAISPALLERVLKTVAP
jgi:Protein of unknown function (DUF4239)